MAQETYTLNGATEFPFPHRVRAKDLLTVEVRPGGIVPPTQWELIGGGPNSTQVTIRYPNAPIDPSADLVVTRYTPAERITIFQTGNVTPAALNSEFDNAYDAVRDFAEQFGAWEGAWETSRFYEPLSVVLAPDDNIYIATVGHESGVFATDLAADRWRLLLNFADSAATVEGFKNDAEAAASAASTSESNAATSESNAATSASNAASSASSASNDADRAEAAAASAAFRLIGEPFPLWDHITGVEPPDNSGLIKFIKLTADDAYNAGLLTNESVSGSSPLVEATAEIATGPLQGETVHLINTEEAMIRARETSGALQQHATEDLFACVQAADNLVRTLRITTPEWGNTHTSSASTGAATGTRTQGSEIRPLETGETRSKNISATYYMRIV